MFNAIRRIWRDLKPKEKQYLSLALWTIAIFGVSSIFILPSVFNLPAPNIWMRFNEKTSNVSNTINGVATPFIALATAVLTFLAFWVQYQANVQQKELFDKELEKKQEDDLARENSWRIDRFENRFYELIKLHKANVDEMAIGDKLNGRKVFLPMFYELRYAYLRSEIILRNNAEIKDRLPASFNLISFVYAIFFYGVGPNSERSFLPGLTQSERELYNIVREKFLTVGDTYQSLRQEHPGSTYFTIDAPLAAADDRLTGNFYYTPFDGHLSRLGHYYRHLFQTANY